MGGLGGVIGLEIKYMYIRINDIIYIHRVPQLNVSEKFLEFDK